MRAVADGPKVKIDLYDPQSFVPAVPHDQFDWLRENAPVFFHPEPNGPGFWVLTRYADIVESSRHYEIFSNAHGTNIEEMASGIELMMINMDPPKHTRLRALVSKGFHPKAVATLEPYIRDLANNIIDGIARRGEADFVTEVAAELPLQVIAEMIGIPQQDRQRIFEWSNRMIGLDDPEYGNSYADATAAAMEMWSYADSLADGHRAEPRHDLIDALLGGEVDGEKLTQQEFDMFFMLLAVAGNETTRNLIAGGMHLLMENPGERERLLADPLLFPSAVEEMLRCVTPVMHFRRTTTRETQIAGQRIGAGDKVTLWYIAANRDPAVFEDPHRFDVGRDPNPHIAFGAGGPHFCLGFSLAQLEIKVMFEELLRRLPDMTMAAPVSRLRSHFINGTKHIPVRFKPEHD